MTVTLWERAQKRNRRSHLSAKPRLEMLETRLVPYSVSGNAWPHPQLVSISFVPDGTNLSPGQTPPITSGLQAAFNAQFGSAAVWQNAILKAAQSWAQQTNINFALVSDNGADLGSGSNQQGDPGFGDIRISGWHFGDGGATLADAWQPPPANNYSIAGDIELNLDAGWVMGVAGGVNVQTVVEHEIGHALGLNHSAATSYAVMWPSYTGYKVTLNADDIAGVRNVYSSSSPRSADSYDAALSNNTFLTASNINSSISTSTMTGLATGLDITTTSDVDYYSFVAPVGSNSTARLKVQSSGLSLLAPKVTVYAADMITVLGSANGAGNYGTTLTVNFPVVGGLLYYVKVQGADATAMGTGAYALTLNFGNNPDPTVPLPNTTTSNGSPLQSGGGQPEGSKDTDLNLNGSDRFVTVSGAAPDARTTATAIATVAGSPLAVTLPANLIAGTSTTPAFNAAAQTPGPGPFLYVTAPSLLNAGPAFHSLLQEGSGTGSNSGGDDSLLPPATIVTPETAPFARAVPANDAKDLPPPSDMSLRRADALFGRDVSAAATHEMAAALASAEFSASADREAALAGLLVALGSFWGNQREVNEVIEKRRDRRSMA